MTNKIYGVTMTNELQQAIKTLADAIRPMMDEIHSMPPSTKNYYGNYMNVLSMEQDEKRRKVIAMAMVAAGANVDGIITAVDIIEGK